MGNASPDPELRSLSYARPPSSAEHAATAPPGNSICTEDPEDPGGDVFNRTSICAVLIILFLALIRDFVQNGGDTIVFVYCVFVLLVCIGAAAVAIRHHLHRLRGRQ